MTKLIVVSRRDDFPVAIDGVELVTAQDYLTDSRFSVLRGVRVFNLCRSYRYQAAGYYVSLLGEARGHRVIPNVIALQNFKSPPVLRVLSEELDELIQRRLRRITSPAFTLSIYFGRNMAARHESLCRALFNQFEAPLLRAHFVKGKRWNLQTITPIAFHEIPESHKPFVHDAAREYFQRRHSPASPRRRVRSEWWIGMLTDPQDPSPPSDPTALKRFIRAGEELGIWVEPLARDELARTGEYDGLFIRATTKVSNFTYRFARKAVAEGLVVIDDPLSIVRCSNKVYLAELLQRHRLPGLKTVIVHRGNVDQLADLLGFPIVLKQPDGAASIGVEKVDSPDALKAVAPGLFAKSDFLVAQAFCPTDFDWRIGILDRKPLFACKYFMARAHWQIYNWSAKPRHQSGSWETLPIDSVPESTVKTALRAANLVGAGFYGVDLKDIGGRSCVIEVNDNPSVESGVEDQVIGDALYRRVMEVFKTRMEHARAGRPD